jgi:hypothetical protein
LGVIDIHTPTWGGVLKERYWTAIVIASLPIVFTVSYCICWDWGNHSYCDWPS